ncbi:3-deoxy-D-manno-octulosonate 8-phosphate phosphatase [Thermogutta terrifontis]|jgi:3-deoxy-D-manno-octulosonate 8-phosphate phosphatase (KDO 8-P phosphatase)|uniref:3-deoxy-D-manno-octulosonate 8-phosphate phosphatase n=2 Tax=Thermogutta terrifontis TaxID=1331910 RepID=A0A286REF1_9BACT|nr:3-deoxy-D-manno-octulosonate 8-phosphate phosphatase [Thermogutta terrifontis]
MPPLHSMDTAPDLPDDLRQRCLAIRAIISDVDGVLTNGQLWLSERGYELKAFHVRDGMGCLLWKKAGYRLGLLSKRRSVVVEQRAREMGVDQVIQGVGPKWPAVESVLNMWGLSRYELCYVGDDLPDISVLQQVGLGVAVADAAWDVRTAAHYVTTAPGGWGALREVIELVLRTQRLWSTLLDSYLAEERGNAGSDRKNCAVITASHIF